MNEENKTEVAETKTKSAFRVICADFVTTEDGTGIVHIAPTFGADDDRAAKQNGIVPMLLLDKNGKQAPMVDLTGKFYAIEDLDADFVKTNVNLDLYKKFAGKFVKDAYIPAEKTETEEQSKIVADKLLDEFQSQLSGFDEEKRQKINAVLRQLAEETLKK